jgi:hypothetical protein
LPDYYPCAVDVLDLQPDHLAGAQAAAIAGTAQHASLGAARDRQQAPGRFRLATNPSAAGSAPDLEDNRNRIATLDQYNVTYPFKNLCYGGNVMKMIVAAIGALLLSSEAFALKGNSCFPPGAPARGQLQSGTNVTVAVAKTTCPSGLMTITGGKMNFQTNANIAPRTCNCTK